MLDAAARTDYLANVAPDQLFRVEAQNLAEPVVGLGQAMAGGCRDADAVARVLEEGSVTLLALDERALLVIDEPQEQCDDNHVNCDGDGEVLDALLNVAACLAVLLAGVLALDPREERVAQKALPRHDHDSRHDDG